MWVVGCSEGNLFAAGKVVFAVCQCVFISELAC